MEEKQLLETCLHSYEVQQIRKEPRSYPPISTDMKEVAIVVCIKCGDVKKKDL